MKRHLKALIFGICLVLCGAFRLFETQAQALTDSTKVKILVEPNVLVSRDGNKSKSETAIAVNPLNPKNLVGASMVFDNPDQFTSVNTYATFDGGQTWQYAVFPQMFGDPQVAFAADGTAILTCLAPRTYPDGKRGLSLNVFRSADGGKTWDKGTDLGYTFDHEQIVVDRTRGKFAGRIYLNTLHEQDGKTTLALVISKDNGKTWVKPKVYLDAPEGLSAVALNPLVLNDGAIFAPFIIASLNQGKFEGYAISFVMSSDGGETFSQRTEIGKQFLGDNQQILQRRVKQTFTDRGFSMFAADIANGKFRDRIYLVRNDFTTGVSRLLFSYSGDRGKTWTPAKTLDFNAPAKSEQFQGHVFVNNQGVLGLMWYDTRDFVKQDQFNVYFTASTDGGETFLPPARLSSAPSTPASTGNITPTYVVAIPTGQTLGLLFNTPFTHHGSGGDYLGITADDEGTFYPLWIDGRGYSYQAMTSRVRVTNREIVRDASPKTKNSLVQKIKLIFDPVQYDPQTQEAMIPVRLQNVSKENLYAPFNVEIKSLANKFLPPGLQDPSAAPQILNAANGKTGDGAIFDYANALRDLPHLPPGAVTEAIIWRVKAVSRTKSNFSFDVDVTGFVQNKP